MGCGFQSVRLSALSVRCYCPGITVDLHAFPLVLASPAVHSLSCGDGARTQDHSAVGICRRVKVLSRKPCGLASFPNKSFYISATSIIQLCMREPYGGLRSAGLLQTLRQEQIRLAYIHSSLWSLPFLSYPVESNAHLYNRRHETCRILLTYSISQSKLSQDELNQLQKDTHFDKKELQQWYKGQL